MMARRMLNIRGKSTLELVRNYFRKNIACNIINNYKYVDTVTVYISHSTKNILFRRMTFVNLVIIYLRHTVTHKRLTKPTLFVYMKHDL